MSFRTNSLGLRGPEIPPKNKRFRILVLGDSYTFGWVLPEGDTYPALLQSQLSSEGSNVEVINGGAPGYGTVQEEDFLKKIYPKIEPDYVVLGFVMNDAEPQNTVPQNPNELYKYASSWMLESLKFFWIQKHFRGSRFLSSRLYYYNGKYLKGFESDSGKWKEARQALKGIKELCASRHSGFLVVILPDVTENLDDTYRFTPIHNTVMRWAKDLKIDAIDVLPAFRGKNRDDYSVPDDGHPNKKANEIIAAQIVSHWKGI
jgi:lysophospholipase L1-like esterase